MNFTLKPLSVHKINTNHLRKLNLSPHNLQNEQRTSKNGQSKQRQKIRLFSKLKSKKHSINQTKNNKIQQTDDKHHINLIDKEQKMDNIYPNNVEDQMQKQKMLTTKATNHNQSVHDQSSFMTVSRQRALKDQIQHFKIIKAHQIADIAIKGQIQIDKVMKRLLPKLQKQLFDCIKNIFDLQESIVDSGTKQQQTKRSSPKQLGSTIEHTFTPKTISTPGFQFQNSSGQQVNQFSIRQTQFTLGNSSSSKKKCSVQQQKSKRKHLVQQKKVSQFNLMIPSEKRLPLSKKIKDKIMNNSKRNDLK